MLRKVKGEPIPKDQNQAVCAPIWGLGAEPGGGEGWLTLQVDRPGITAIEFYHALNARESHQTPIVEVVGLCFQGKNSRGALEKRWLGSGVPSLVSR